MECSPRAIFLHSFSGIRFSVDDPCFMVTNPELTQRETLLKPGGRSTLNVDPWTRPGSKSHAYLQLGFALTRANARMLINAGASRRSAHNRVRKSRLRSPT